VLKSLRLLRWPNDGKSDPCVKSYFSTLHAVVLFTEGVDVCSRQTDSFGRSYREIAQPESWIARLVWVVARERGGVDISHLLAWFL
jgi:hypothetical protein